MSVALPVGLSRNGGHGSIEESEIFHFSPDFLCSSLVSGGVILAGGRGATGTADHRIFGQFGGLRRFAHAMAVDNEAERGTEDRMRREEQRSALGRSAHAMDSNNEGRCDYRAGIIHRTRRHGHA